MNSPLKIFIADDEQRAIDTLSKALTAFFDNIHIAGTATNVKDAYSGILETKPDLLFLDIEMGSESGFQLLEKFDKIDFHIAFVTAHEEFALKAIKFSALDYIIKPAGIQDLKALILKVEQNPLVKSEAQKVKHMFGNFLQSDKNEHKITVAIAEGYDFIKVRDILYLKADGSYTIFCLKDGSKLTTSKSLKFFESMLEGYGFFRIHNSTLINLRYIRRINKSAGGSAIMEDNEEFSISKSRKDEFMELLSLR
jgi:two-component system LytT family response regulator